MTESDRNNKRGIFSDRRGEICQKFLGHFRLKARSFSVYFGLIRSISVYFGQFGHFFGQFGQARFF